MLLNNTALKLESPLLLALRQSLYSQEPWEIIDSWQGYTQEVGTIVDPAGIELRGDWGAIGRRVSIAETDVFIEPLQVFIMGRTVTVTVFSEDGRELTTVHRFIPEPQS